MPVGAPELLAGVALDLAFGDPQWMPHPVRGIGRLADAAERFWRKIMKLTVRSTGAHPSRRAHNLLAVAATVFATTADR